MGEEPAPLPALLNLSIYLDAMLATCDLSHIRLHIFRQYCFSTLISVYVLLLYYLSIESCFLLYSSTDEPHSF